jgi:hypothetical protein
MVTPINDLHGNEIDEEGTENAIIEIVARTTLSLARDRLANEFGVIVTQSINQVLQQQHIDTDVMPSPLVSLIIEYQLSHESIALSLERQLGTSISWSMSFLGFTSLCHLCACI